MIEQMLEFNKRFVESKAYEQFVVRGYIMHSVTGELRPISEEVK